MMEEQLENVQDKNLVQYNVGDIKNMIYTIRGKQVMLDSDVAMLYHCETRIINQAVKRNIDRFPERFCFKLTESEVANLKSQFVTSSLTKENYGGRRKLPTVFTEQGIAMLSGLLRNEIAIQVSINIMDAFVEMRRFITQNGHVFQEINSIKGYDKETREKYEKVFNQLQLKKENEFTQKIFFDGQIYDAYSLIIDIIKKAKEKILIIDNYIDDSVLKMLIKKNKNVKVTILTSERSNIEKLDIQKFNKEYPQLEIAKTNKFHDRFILLDDRELYHCGASLKDLGKKCFAISRIEEKKYIEILKQS